MWRCPEPGQRIPDVRGISPPQYRTDDGRLATGTRVRPGPTRMPGNAAGGFTGASDHAARDGGSQDRAGVVFGLGFDTATEVALLVTTALLASQHIPWYAIICLPVLFTAGMTLMDTTDGLFMNMAYGWAFFNPVRKVYYNLAITGLSVAICFVIGAVEALSLLPQEIHGLSRTTGFWGLMYRFNINTAGFVIVGLFLATWLAALLIWRFARIEEKWNPAPGPARSAAPRD